MAEREPVFYRAAEAAGFISFPGTVALEDWDRVGEALLGLLARERKARKRAERRVKDLEQQRDELCNESDERLARAEKAENECEQARAERHALARIAHADNRWSDEAYEELEHERGLLIARAEKAEAEVARLRDLLEGDRLERER